MPVAWMSGAAMSGAWQFAAYNLWCMRPEAKKVTGLITSRSAPTHLCKVRVCSKPLFDKLVNGSCSHRDSHKRRAASLESVLLLLSSPPA
jgi:hypothetical protein